MSSQHPICRDLEPDLVAAATGEAGAAATERVREHVGRCTPCRDDFERYRSIEGMCERLRERPAGGDEARARRALACRLADLKRRIVTYRIFPSPLGNILLARSEDGVSLVEYLGEARTFQASRLAREGDVEAVEDGEEIERHARELLDYLEGRRTRLDWPLDFRLARGEFDRMVLTAAAQIPYGAVTSYARLAAEIGKPTAARAVAQALRWNPVPVVVPCHRVVGSSGSLVGYAGDKIGLKRRLLDVEGVPTAKTARDWQVARGTMYVRYKADAEYCVPTCGSLSKRSLAALTLFGSRERAEAIGLGPCTTCRPDLHPIAR
jgi:methylated-DNA-[protein]-cysteine S-methyltransferase